MKTMFTKRRLMLMTVAGTLAVAGGCTSMQSMMMGQSVVLTGNNQNPPVVTSAEGTGMVTVKNDRSVTAKVTVSGMAPTAAHIHEGAKGTNGPVIVPFVKEGDNTFVAPPGSTLTEAQYASYKAGNLYVNVHSAKNPGGEVRAQLAGK